MKAIGPQHPLKSAVAAINEAMADAMATAEMAVAKAVRVGHLLIETKPLIGHTNFQDWLENTFPQVSVRTLQRWMAAAERTIAATGIQPYLLTAPISEILAAEPPEGASAQTLEARQTIFDFMKDKTIKDCLEAVVVGGEEAHRITRAANGKKLGGSKGENRKDWPKFIGRLLSDVSHHLKSFNKYSTTQVEGTFVSMKRFIGKCPTGVLTTLKNYINEELKTR